MLIALLALFVALTGSATAAVIVSSSDQLAPGVVTSSKLAETAVTNSRIGDGAVNSRALNVRAVHNFNMLNPIFSATVLADGTATSKVGVTETSKVPGIFGRGLYNVTFDRDISNCAIVATPGQTGVMASTFVSGNSRVATVGLSRSTLNESPTTTNVIASPIDGGFTVMVQC